MAVSINTEKQIAMMGVAGALAAEVLEMISEYGVPGATTEALDQRCHDYMRKVQKTTPANVGRHGFSKTLCTSIDSVVCHGIPSNKVMLMDGDIINIDITVIKNGWHGDTSRMYFQTLAEGAGYSVVREYCGHGIGKIYHEGQQVLHDGTRNSGLLLREDMIFTIEPMINLGARGMQQFLDGWIVVIRDGSLPAQWEQRIAVMADGADILMAWLSNKLSSLSM